MMEKRGFWLYPIMLSTASPSLQRCTSITSLIKIAALLAYLADHVVEIKRRYTLYAVTATDTEAEVSES